MSEPEWTELANDIRVVDGNHDLGAGALAAALTERGWTKREAREAAAGEALPCDAEVADDEGEHHCSLSPGHKPGDGGRHYSFIPADNHWCEGRTGHSDLPFGHWFRTARAREIAAGLAEIGTGGTPEFIRGYNAGYDDAYDNIREAAAGEALDVERLAAAAQDHETSGIHGPLHCSLACGATIAERYARFASSDPTK